MIELSGVEADQCRIGVAGDTFNTAVALSRAGIAVDYVSALGTDGFSDRILAALRAEGVGTDRVLRVPGGKPGLYAVQLDERGERSFSYWRGEAAVRNFADHPEADTVLDAAIGADLLYLSGITLSVVGETGRTKLEQMARAVRGNGGRVAFDTNYRPAGWASREAAAEAVAAFGTHVDIALPTFEDDAALFGDADVAACARRWQGWGAGEVAVKDGPNGAWLAIGDGGVWSRPPERIAPRDTTGAGDAFTGAYLATRMQDLAAPNAAAAGHAAAAAALRVFGAIPPRHESDKAGTGAHG